MNENISSRCIRFIALVGFVCLFVSKDLSRRVVHDCSNLWNMHECKFLPASKQAFPDVRAAQRQVGVRLALDARRGGVGSARVLFIFAWRQRRELPGAEGRPDQICVNYEICRKM